MGLIPEKTELLCGQVFEKMPKSPPHYAALGKTQSNPQTGIFARTALRRLEVEDMNKSFVPTDDYLRRWNIDHEPHWDIFQRNNPK